MPSLAELKIGEIAGAVIYIRKPDVNNLKSRQLVVDVGPGSGGLFLMERRLGVRFFTKLRKLPEAGG